MSWAMKLWGAALLAFGLSTAVFMVLPPTPTQSKQAVIVPAKHLASDDLPAYDTLEEAAVHAEARAYVCSHYYECGGTIAQRPDGRYVVGPVSSDYHGDDMMIHHGVPAGWKLVADFHTHPCLPDSHLPGYFSPQDTMENIAKRITGFVLDQCTGKVHEFDPLTMKPDAEQVEGYYLTAGRVIGQIPVVGTSIEPSMGL